MDAIDDKQLEKLLSSRTLNEHMDTLYNLMDIYKNGEKSA